MTTDTLRNFGRFAEVTQSKTRELSGDLAVMEKRTTLQKKELVRQVEMLQHLREKVDNMRAEGNDILQNRLKEAAENQRRLTDRVERVLQRCLNGSSTALSDVEIQWFKELAELNGKISDQGDGNSLQERAEMVSTAPPYTKHLV